VVRVGGEKQGRSVRLALSFFNLKRLSDLSARSKHVRRADGTQTAEKEQQDTKESWVALSYFSRTCLLTVTDHQPLSSQHAWPRKIKVSCHTV
jgi:hypothetical protein